VSDLFFGFGLVDEGNVGEKHIGLGTHFSSQNQITIFIKLNNKLKRYFHK
jgi:hypothetical protein